MNDLVEPALAPWWRRIPRQMWAHPGFHGVVMMLVEVGTFVLLAWLLTLAVKFLLPLPEIGFEARLGEQGPNLFLRVLRSVLVVGLAYWLMVRFVQRRRATELAPRKLPVHAAAGWGVGMAILVVAALLMAAFGVLRWQGGLNPDAKLLGPLFALGLAPGITEELMFRGVLFGVVERAFGTWASLAISSLFFGLAHYGNPNATLWSSVAIAIEAGLLLGLAYAWTRSMWFVMGLHAAWNFTQGPVLGIPVSGLQVDGLFNATASGSPILSGGAFGAEASILTVALCVAFALWFGRKAVAAGRIVRASWNRPRGQAPVFD